MCLKLISREGILMAKYRQLYTEFWSDSFVLELTPEEKHFYLYLISNSKTTQWIENENNQCISSALDIKRMVFYYGKTS
jgi:hypothetical protein